MQNNQLSLFFEKLTAFITEKSMIKLVLSNQREVTSDLRSILIHLIEIKKGNRINFVYHYKTKDLTKNFDRDEALVIIKKSLETEFFNADLFTTGETIQLTASGRGKVRITSTRPVLTPAASFSHDRVKHRVIEPGNNIYLRELGILNSGFEVRREMNDKYQQINRYIELIAPFIAELQLETPSGCGTPSGSKHEFHVADMGSGKGYLTFALYDYLTNVLGKSPAMTGVESREELVKLSNEIAGKASFDRLKFICGTISDVKLDKIDVLIALHACDTATDDAIFMGITGGASLIVCAPCCHKQVRKEFRVTNELKGVLKHGILEERQAEIITDGIRALVLEAHGYKTKVFEFISMEHTPKNVMIVGRKLPGKPAGREKIMERIRLIREMFGINQHYLEEKFTLRGSPGTLEGPGINHDET